MRFKGDTTCRRDRLAACLPYLSRHLTPGGRSVPSLSGMNITCHSLIPSPTLPSPPPCHSPYPHSPYPSAPSLPYLPGSWHTSFPVSAAAFEKENLTIHSLSLPCRVTPQQEHLYLTLLTPVDARLPRHQWHLYITRS